MPSLEPCVTRKAARQILRVPLNGQPVREPRRIQQDGHNRKV